VERACLSAPSFYCALQTLSVKSAQLWSHFRFWLRETEKYVWVCSRTTTPPDAIGTEQQTQARLMRLIGIFGQYLGFRWRPELLLLETRRVPSQLFVEILDGVRCIPGARFSAVPIPRNLLAKSGPVTRESAEVRQAWLRADDPIDWAWLQRVRAMLPEYVIGNQLSIESLADIACVSPRSLQRALAEEGLTFRELLETARFEVAQQCLREPATSIAEISELLGYSAPTHFARAFRRIAGRTPSEYRKDLARAA
jgi:AraC-like DNA-binding protein